MCSIQYKHISFTVWSKMFHYLRKCIIVPRYKFDKVPDSSIFSKEINAKLTKYFAHFLWPVQLYWASIVYLIAVCCPHEERRQYGRFVSTWRCVGMVLIIKNELETCIRWKYSSKLQVPQILTVSTVLRVNVLCYIPPLHN